MSRPIALVLALALTASCTMSSSSRRTATLGGIGLGVAGVLVMSQGPVDSDNNGTNDWVLNDNFGAYLLGALLISGGAGVLLAAASAEDPPAAVTMSPAPAPVSAAAIEDAMPPLPELPVTPEVLQLAKHLRMASTRGRCQEAWSMLDRLFDADARYAGALRDGPVMATCVH